MSPETCRADLKKTNKRKSYCISLVVYINVPVMHGHTNIKLNKIFVNLHMQINGPISKEGELIQNSILKTRKEAINSKI